MIKEKPIVTVVLPTYCHQRYVGAAIKSVLNQTLEEAEQTILTKAEDYLINPFVLVKLANFEITILGEVNVPGRYPVYKEGLTIYDALAMAGDPARTESEVESLK